MGRRRQVQARPHDFHAAIRCGQGLEAVATVERMGIAGEQHEAAQALQVGMGEQGLDHPIGEPLAAMHFEHVDIAQVGEGGAVGDDAGETDLPHPVSPQRDAQRVRDGPLDGRQRDAFAPLGGAQEGMRRRGIDLVEAEPVARRQCLQCPPPR